MSYKYKVIRRLVESYEYALLHGDLRAWKCLYYLLHDRPVEYYNPRNPGTPALWT